MVVLKYWKWDQKMNIHRMQEKEIKTLFENSVEKELLFAKHAIFATEISRQTVASFTRQNTSSQKFWKICKVFFVTGSFTREGVASWAAKIFVYPSRLDLPLTNKLPKPTRELVTVACDLDDPRLSRQNWATLFLKFSVFVKTKYFPKTPKTLKNLFVFELTNEV